MTLKQLKDKKNRLEASAASKLAEIKDDTAEEARRKIEADHAKLLAQVVEVDEQIERMEAESDRAEEAARQRKHRQQQRAAAANDGDGADDDKDGDQGQRSSDDGDEDDDDADKGKRRESTTDPADPPLNRAVMAEMILIDEQARKLGINVKLTEAIKRGETPEDLRKFMFAELAKKSSERGPRGSTGDQNGRAEVLTNERAVRNGGLEIAMVRRILDHSGLDYAPKERKAKKFFEQYRDASDQYLGMGIVETAALCIDYRGSGLITSRKANDIIERAFHSTSDFPAIFQNALNKTLLARYELVMPTYRSIAQERSFNDFRPHPQVRAGDFPTLQPVTQTGELAYGTTSDTGENVSVLPYGIVFTISRHMLVNDDLGAIDTILGSVGDGVLTFENTTFYTMLKSNPVLLQDSTAVFASGHGNLAGTGAAPAIATLDTARQGLRAMKSLTGQFLNVPPAIILSGPFQETTIDQLVTTITPALVGSVNPFSGKLRPVFDANISDKSWYLFTEPGRVPTFVYGFLNGATGPRTRTYEPFGVQGVKISVELDFGVGAIDYRGAYKSPTY